MNKVVIPQFSDLRRLIPVAKKVLATRGPWAVIEGDFGGWEYVTTGGGCTALSFDLPKGGRWLAVEDAEVPESIKHFYLCLEDDQGNITHQYEVSVGAWSKVTVKEWVCQDTNAEVILYAEKG